MTLQPIGQWTVPKETERVARAAFPKGNIYMKMSEELGQIYVDSDFKNLYPARCGQLEWREPSTTGLPPNKIKLESPYDPEARNRTKRQTNWTGYTAHVSETCEEDSPNLITNVETTPATTPDGAMTEVIHGNLSTKAKKGPRMLKFRHQEQHEALQVRRQRQTTSEFQQEYALRAGVEGTLVRLVRALAPEFSTELGD